mmetsp:Transcript_27991/g.80309  ORF Transcript_27991/g.80309 Transcript_27991/m.80309 type:complete len:214 (+) Transcript_27991:228-869(+)
MLQLQTLRCLPLQYVLGTMNLENVGYTIRGFFGHLGHYAADALHLLHNLLSQVNDILHGGRVRPAQLQDEFHKVFEGHVFVLEDEVRVLHQAHNIYTNFLDELGGIWQNQQLLKLLPRQGPIPVHVKVKSLNHLQHLGPDHVHHQCLVLDLGNRGHGFHQDTDQHIHDGQRRDHNEQNQQQSKPQVLVSKRQYHLCQVRKGSMQEQRNHRTMD